MIEQINDLMYRAGLTAQGCWDSMDDYDREAILKFAELIVRECMEICRSEDWEDQQGWGKLYAHNIKKHFGI